MNRFLQLSSNIDLLLLKKLLYLFFLIIFILKTSNYINHIDFKDPPDQYAHLSYIEYVKNTPFKLIPNFEDMKLQYSVLNDNNKMNYLSHPPLYYYLMLLIPKNNSIESYISNLQKFNLLISTISYILLLYIGYSMKVNILAHLGFLSLVNAIPMIPYIGASINNDNLSILAGMFFLIGLLKLFENQNSKYSYFFIFVGLFLGYFTKLTLFLLMFFTLIFYIYYFITKKISIKKNLLFIITLSVIVFIPIIFYQLNIIFKYDSIYPALSARSIEEYTNSRFYVEEEKRIFLSIFQWLERLFGYWLIGWFGIMSENSFAKTNIFQYIGIFLLHFFAFLAIYDNRKKDDSYFIVGKFGLIAIIIVVTIQFYFSYNSHLSTGYLGGLQSRYYLPFVSIFAILSSLFINNIKSILGRLLIIFIILHTIFYDFIFTKTVLFHY